MTTQTPPKTTLQSIKNAFDTYQDATHDRLDASCSIVATASKHRHALAHVLTPQAQALLDAYAVLEPMLDSDKHPQAYAEKVSDLLDVLAFDFIEQARDFLQHPQTVASGFVLADIEQAQGGIEQSLDGIDHAQALIEQAQADIKTAQGIIKTAQDRAKHAQTLASGNTPKPSSTPLGAFGGAFANVTQDHLDHIEQSR